MHQQLGQIELVVLQYLIFKMEKIIGIYVITSPTKKFYVGQSWDIYRRWKTYNKQGAIGQPYLYNSFVKYGVKNHKFRLIEKYGGDNQFELDSLEYFHWNKLNALGFESLNCREPKGANGKHSYETRQKMSISNKGKNLGKKCTDEKKKKLSESLKGKNLGKNRTKETKIKMSLSHIGKMSSKHKNSIRNSNSKLTSENVIVIWKMLKEGDKEKSIADMFKVNRKTINYIKRGKTWNHITHKMNI